MVQFWTMLGSGQFVKDYHGSTAVIRRGSRFRPLPR